MYGRCASGQLAIFRPLREIHAGPGVKGRNCPRARRGYVARSSAFHSALPERTTFFLTFSFTPATVEHARRLRNARHTRRANYLIIYLPASHKRTLHARVHTHTRSHTYISPDYTAGRPSFILHRGLLARSTHAPPSRLLQTTNCLQSGSLLHGVYVLISPRTF